MKILITGATGFLGRAICEEFGGDEFEVFTISRKPMPEGNSEKHFQIDIADSESARQIESLPKIDAVIHAAGLAHRFNKTDRKEFWQVNVEGTRNVVERASKLNAGHFVLISSVAVYGNSGVRKQNPQPINENSLCSPTGDYAESKYEAEKTARQICSKNRVRLTVLRPATIIGEGDPGNLLRLIKIIDKNRFVWIGDGENLKSLIYKRDVAAACRLITSSNASDNDFDKGAVKIYNAAAPSLKMREIVGEIAGALGKSIPKRTIPKEFIIEGLKTAERLTGLRKIGRLSETVAKWISDENFSGEKLLDEFGFAPRTSVKEAIRREVDFYKRTT